MVEKPAQEVTAKFNYKIYKQVSFFQYPKKFGGGTTALLGKYKLHAAKHMAVGFALGLVHNPSGFGSKPAQTKAIKYYQCYKTEYIAKKCPCKARTLRKA